MEVPFDHEQINQIDTIKKAIKKDFEKLGFDVKPAKVTDLMALEYALAFTSEVISIDFVEKEPEKEYKFTSSPSGGKSLRIF